MASPRIATDTTFLKLASFSNCEPGEVGYELFCRSLLIERGFARPGEAITIARAQAKKAGHEHVTVRHTSDDAHRIEQIDTLTDAEKDYRARFERVQQIRQWQQAHVSVMPCAVCFRLLHERERKQFVCTAHVVPVAEDIRADLLSRAGGLIKGGVLVVRQYEMELEHAIERARVLWMNGKEYW